MGSVSGKKIKVSLFGESHGKGIGAVIDGLPSGFAIDMKEVQRQMERRAPGKSGPWSTKRSEPDIPVIYSGIFNGLTTGSPVCAIIENTNNKPGDYDVLKNIPRPGHADLTALYKFEGAEDKRGGGHFSGRITAGLVFAGAVCKQIIEQMFPVRIHSHIYSIGTVSDISFDEYLKNSDIYNTDGVKHESISDYIDEQLDALNVMDFPVLESGVKSDMIELIEKVKLDCNSIGGIIETIITGFPAGVGDPFFDGVESRLASVLFSIPAVKGVEFGKGFGCSKTFGSDNNDGLKVGEKGSRYCSAVSFKNQTAGNISEKVKFTSNNAGGLYGGITAGTPIIIRTGFKPTPSIATMQNSVDLSKLVDVEMKTEGRHDPCIVPRAVPVVEAACSLVLLDMLL